MLLPIVDFPAPQLAIQHLDDLWFQVAGTRCNLTCHHCFISCSPHNDSFGFLSLETVRRYLEESVELGVKEYYFTGGEPFLNPEMTGILELTLNYGPASVLTNGTVFKDAWLERLAHVERKSIYSLEFRVSIDGFSAAQNDPIRGAGTFERALRGIRQLVHYGFAPIVTVTRTRDDQNDADLVAGFTNLLRENGYERPRLKILPTLRIGAEAERERGYFDDERVTSEMLELIDESVLLCSHSRVVTDRGVFVCPILIDAPDAKLGSMLAESLQPYSLKHHACHTCYQYGSLCANPSGSQSSDW